MVKDLEVAEALEQDECRGNNERQIESLVPGSGCVSTNGQGGRSKATAGLCPKALFLPR